MKRTALFSIFALLCSTAGWAQTLPPVVERYEQMLVRSPGKGAAFEKVYQHFFEGEGVEKLAARWRQLAEAGGANAANYWLLLGLLGERQGRNEEAISFYEKVAQLKPDDWHAWQALGDLQVSAGKFPAAIAALQKALTAGAPSEARPRLYRQLARSQQRNFDAAGAIATWQKFVAEAPDDPFVLEEAGESLAEAEKFPEARMLFEKLRDGAGTDPYQRVRAIIKIAQLEEQQGRTAPARDLYESALPLAAEGSWMHREVRTRIEELFRRQDDLPGLTDYYTRWLEKHPKDVEAALRQSDVLIELNKKKDAVEWLRKAAEWAPDRTEVQVSLAKRLGETGQPEEAVKILAKLVQEKPEDQSFPELLGELQWLNFEKTKDPALRDAAVASWKKLAPPAIKDPAWVGRLADLLRGHRLSELALVEYRRAIALAPAVNDLRERLIEYLFELDRDPEAWAELDALGKVENPDFLRVAKLQGRHSAPDAALASVERGLEKDPKNFDLLSLKWQLLSEAKRWPETLALFDVLTEAAPNTYFLDDLELRYLSVLSAAEKAEAFQKERVAKLGQGTLDERDLRLVSRQLLSTGDLETLRKALDEGRTRFPNSFPLARFEVEYAKRTSDLEGRIKGLRRLIELQPKLKTDLLREVVAAYREESQWDQALAVVQELTAASPANAEVQALGADVLLAADRFEEGVKKMREAVRLSDNPNGLRMRLSRILLDRGELSRAREVLDEAFEAAEKPQDRLALMPQLTEAYFIDGKLDTLLERFRQRQRAEDEGWRYALYLAEIYKQTLDVGAARRELARALAARPRDSGLLRQMVKLATDEQNRVEVARYQQLLTEAEPSDNNQCALVEALLENTQPEPAMTVLRRQYAAINRVPGAWERLMPMLARYDQLPKLGEFLNEQGLGKADVETRLQLAIVQTTQGQIEEARKAFWAIWMLPSPPPPPTAPEKPDPNQTTAFVYRPTPTEQRLYTAYQTRQTVERVLNASNYGSSMSMSGYTPAKVGPVDTARDTALLYLAGLAVRENQAPAFLAELDRQLAQRQGPKMETMLAYGLVQAKDKILEEVRKYLREAGSDDQMDRYCLSQIMEMVQNNRYSNEKADFDKEEMTKIFETLLPRVMGKTNYPRGMWNDSSMYFYAALEMPEKVKAARQNFLSKVDLTKSDQAVTAIRFALAEDNLPLAKQACAAVAEAARKSPNSSTVQNLQWLPTNLFDYSEPMKTSAETRAEIVAEVLALWYPKTVPRPSLGGNRNRYWMGDNPLPPTRFFDLQKVATLAQLASQFDAMIGNRSQNASKVGLPELRRRLEEQANTLPPAQRIFPRLVLVYFDAWSGETESATTGINKLLAEQPGDDDLRLLAGAILGRNKKYQEAVEVLAQIPTRAGSGNLDVQKLLLAYAKLAGDQDTARKAALRLIPLQLTSEERTSLATDLKTFGLADKADQVSKMAAAAPSRSSNPLYDSYRELRKLSTDRKEDEALAVARRMLMADPAKMIETEYAINEALGAFQTFGKLGDFMAETEAGLANSPDSLRLNYILARASQLREAPDGSSMSGPKVKLPCWLRLVREGGKITGFYSTDGQAWKAVGSMALGMEGPVSAGLVLVSKEKTIKTSAEFADVQVEPAAPAADATGTPAADGALPAPWTTRDIGKVEQPGGATFADGIFKQEAGGGWIGFKADALRFTSQTLAGDGSITVRVTATGDPKGFGEAGLMIRATDDPKSFSASMVVVPDQPVRFKYRFADGSALRYLQKVVELRPAELKYQRVQAQWLNRIGRTDEAAAIYTTILEKNPEIAMESIDEVVSLYRSAKRLDELVGKLVTWVPSAKSNRDWSYSFGNVARSLEQDKRPDLTEKICRQGLAILTYDDGSQLTASLAKAQLAQGRKDEAMKTFMEIFLPREKKATNGQPTLGFQSSRYVDSRPRWLRSLSSGNEGLSLEALNTFSAAREKGVLPELCRQLLETVKPEAATGAEGESRVLRAYIKVLLRDPAGVEEMRTCLAEKSGDDNTVITMAIAAAREMKMWPGQEQAALEFTRTIRPRMDGDSFVRYGLNRFVIGLARFQEQLGDPGLPETLRNLAALINEDNALRGTQNRPGFRWDDADVCLSLLLRAGMEDDYIKFLEQMKKTPEGANIAYNLDEERKVFRAEKKSQAMVWLNEPATGETTPIAEVAYEIRIEHPHDQGDVYQYLASRLRSVKALEKERTIKFLYGRQRENMQPLGEITTTSARGTWKGEVPLGAGWMSVHLVENGAEIASPAVAVFRGANLIANPGYEGLANRAPELTEFEISGWPKLPSGYWRNGTGGPRGDAVVEYEARERGQEKLLVGQRVPLEKGKVYQQSGWLRAVGALNCTAELGRRYLDAEGKDLKTTYCPVWWGYNWRWHSQRLAFETLPDVEQIPAEAAFFQPVLKIKGGAEWSGLFFGGTQPTK